LPLAGTAQNTVQSLADAGLNIETNDSQFVKVLNTRAGKVRSQSYARIAIALFKFLAAIITLRKRKVISVFIAPKIVSRKLVQSSIRAQEILISNLHP